jgi:hypothetical protein
MAKRGRDLLVMLICQGCATEHPGRDDCTPIARARFGEPPLLAGPVNVLCRIGQARFAKAFRP